MKEVVDLFHSSLSDAGGASAVDIEEVPDVLETVLGQPGFGLRVGLDDDVGDGHGSIVRRYVSTGVDMPSRSSLRLASKGKGKTKHKARSKAKEDACGEVSLPAWPALPPSASHTFDLGWWIRVAARILMEVSWLIAVIRHVHSG